MTIERLKELNEQSQDKRWAVFELGGSFAPLIVNENGGTLFNSTNHGNMEVETKLSVIARNMIPDFIGLYDAVKNKSYADMKDICQRLEKGEGVEHD